MPELSQSTLGKVTVARSKVTPDDAEPEAEDGGLGVIEVLKLR